MKKLLLIYVLFLGVSMTTTPSKHIPQNVYAIFANDNTKGLSHQLFTDSIKTLEKQGAHVDQLKLYDHMKEVPFYQHGKEVMESYPFYMDNQKRFLAADTLLLVFPLYWYSYPAILKAWIDMINAWAYKFEEKGKVTPLHSVKKMIVIYTSMLDHQSLQEQVHNSVELNLKETCKFLSIPEIEIYHVDTVYGKSKEELTTEIKNIIKKL